MPAARTALTGLPRAPSPNKSPSSRRAGNNSPAKKRPAKTKKKKQPPGAGDIAEESNNALADEDADAGPSSTALAELAAKIPLVSESALSTVMASLPAETKLKLQAALTATVLAELAARVPSTSESELRAVLSGLAPDTKLKLEAALAPIETDISDPDLPPGAATSTSASTSAGAEKMIDISPSASPPTVLRIYAPALYPDIRPRSTPAVFNQPTVNRAALIVIDGWGEREEEYGNAIMQAKTPVMDGFKADAQHWAVLEASGLAVGLPPNTMGNSEVGHLTIGAGAVDYQDLVRINKSVEEGTLQAQESLVSAFAAATSGTGRLHLFGLLSDGGVHSHQEHLYALVAAAKAAGVSRTLLHVCTDGRDTPPTSGAGYIEALETKLAEIGHGEISTIAGRYYAMDRDTRWERVQLAYDVMCRADDDEACLAVAPGGVKAIVEAKYAMEEPEKDEFIKPTGLVKDGGIHDGDVFMCFNFRADRAREMFECISKKPKFETTVARKPAMCLQMTRYNSSFASPIVFPPQQLTNGLCETVSKQKLTQFHVAETEKYAHVTFFFNGGREEPFEGEVRELKESPKVATYDLAPTMAAEPVADAMVREIEAGTHPLLICNLAPPDMVGHTGFMDKAIEAAKHTDMCVGKIRDACVAKGVALFILADHGNCETMLTPEGKPMTSHSTTAVPFVGMVPKESTLKFNRAEGGVADVAPTMLTYMGIDVPAEMTGKSFF